MVTHGNGPQVGFILRRSELAIDEVDPVPVDYAVADTQGAIGYMFVKALRNELARRSVDRPVVAVVTQTVVDPDDPAFDHPTKPVGSFFDEATAQPVRARARLDGRRGRRPRLAAHRARRRVPLEIVETETIRTLTASGAIVVAGGGGGIPVTRAGDGSLVGVEAVIDKDLASALLAARLGADLLAIPTGVERVAINFGEPDQQWLDRLTVGGGDAARRGGPVRRGQHATEGRSARRLRAASVPVGPGDHVAGAPRRRARPAHRNVDRGRR